MKPEWRDHSRIGKRNIIRKREHMSIIRNPYTFPVTPLAQRQGFRVENVLETRKPVRLCLKSPCRQQDLFVIKFFLWLNGFV